MGTVIWNLRKGILTMVVLLGDLARLVNGQLHGDENIPISGADIIRDARYGDITLAENARVAESLSGAHCSAVLTPPDFQPDGIAFITVADVHEAFAKIVACFRPPVQRAQFGISDQAIVSPTAQVGNQVTIHPGATVGDYVTIGDRCVIHAGARIMSGCRLGEDVQIFPNAVLYENTLVGARSMIQAAAVIGAYGFGYSTQQGRHCLSAQLGHVEIGPDVDIGAGTTIDRGTYGATVIGEGTKIDNLVMIAHNCRIGKHNLICSQVGIAGSTTTGDYVVMAGQVGVRDHVEIGDGVALGAKAGVMNDVPAGARYVGIPATPERQQMVIQAAIMKLPELKKQIKALKRAVAELEAGAEASLRQGAA
jgi:UDP-3-O-[3-hydroxymyristoyl] glucosamine N-acyltransferase